MIMFTLTGSLCHSFKGTLNIALKGAFLFIYLAGVCNSALSGPMSGRV